MTVHVHTNTYTESVCLSPPGKDHVAFLKGEGQTAYYQGITGLLTVVFRYIFMYIQHINTTHTHWVRLSLFTVCWHDSK